MNLTDLTRLLKTATQKGCSAVLGKSEAAPDFLSKAEAYRQYGRSTVDRWIAEGLLDLSHDREKTSKPFINRKKLEAIAHSSNRITYLPAADRKGKLRPSR